MLPTTDPPPDEPPLPDWILALEQQYLARKGAKLPRRPPAPARVPPVPTPPRRRRGRRGRACVLAPYAEAIQQALAQGVSRPALAQQYHVDVRTVYRFLRQLDQHRSHGMVA